jgi:hypothetical protein
MLTALAVFIVRSQRNESMLFKRRAISNPFERAVNIYIAISVGMYIYMLTVALEPFRCFKQFDNSFTLVSSPSLDCFDGTWSNHWFSILLGLFYIIAMPGSIIFIFWKYRFSLNTNFFIWRFGLLTSRFKRQYYWWSLYVLAKKTLLVMLVDLTNDYNAQLRSFMVLLVLIFTMCVESLCKPYKINIGFARQLNLMYVHLNHS